MKKYFHSLQSKITLCILLFVIIPVMAINIVLQLQLEKQLLKNTDFAFQNAVVNVDNTLKTLYAGNGGNAEYSLHRFCSVQGFGNEENNF